MLTQPEDEHPIWSSRAALARRSAALAAAGPSEVVCRIALSSAEMRALIGSGAPPEGTTRIAAWDPPITLLADDEALAGLLRTAGLEIPAPTSTFAQRDGEARDRLAAATHRFEDHGEVEHGAALEARVAVVVAWGAEHVRTLLGRLVREVAQSGVLVDAREPRELRVFALASLARKRLLLVRIDAVEDISLDDLDVLLARIAG